MGQALLQSRVTLGYCKVVQLYYKVRQFFKSRAVHKPKVQQGAGQKNLLSPPLLPLVFQTKGQMEAHFCKYDQCGLRVETYNMLNWSSEESDLFRKIHPFVKVPTMYDVFAFIGYAILKIVRNMM